MSLHIPYDEPAEREVAGTAVGTPTGYALAAAVVAPSDFYTPSLARLFGACAELDEVRPGWDSSERIRLVARAASVDEAMVRALVENRCRFHDVHAEYAHRVADAAERRRYMVALAEGFNALGEGATPDEAHALMAHMLEAA